MRILVTGGGGYLGCPLVSLLLEKGHHVRLFDRFCFGRESVKPFENKPNCDIVEGDVRRLQEHPSLLDGVDAVAHLASLSNDPSCDLDADMALDINVESTRELAKQAAEKRRLQRLFLGCRKATWGVTVASPDCAPQL